jgi:hypothetical protein
LLADGHLAEARTLLTGDAASQFVPRPESPDAPPVDPEQAEPLILEGLRSDSLARAVNGQRNPGLFESVSKPAFTGPKTTVAVAFSVKDSPSGEHRDVDIQMVRARAYEAEGKPWRVDRWVTSEAHSAH